MIISSPCSRSALLALATQVSAEAMKNCATEATCTAHGRVREMKKLEELHEGRAQLSSVRNSNETFDVDYSILFRFDLSNHRPGSPYRVFRSATVNYVRSVDGTSIPNGEYLLAQECEITRVNNRGSWQVLEWPQG